MEEALARRERLKALRDAAAVAQDGVEKQPPVEAEKPVLKFRNYSVQDQKNIEHEKVEPAQPPKFVEPVVENKPEDAAQEELLVNIAPKKANWDLKRDIQAKLDKLERRTQRAILEVLQEEEKRRFENEAIQET